MAVGRLLTFLESSREEDFFYFFFSREKEGTGGEGIALIRAGSAGSVLGTEQGREHGEVLAALYPAASAHCTCWWSLYAAVNQGRHAGLRRRWGWATVLHGSVQRAGWRDGVLEGRRGGHVARAGKGARGTWWLPDGCTSGPSIRAPALVFAQWEPQLGRMGRSERQGEGRREGGGVPWGEGCGVEIARDARPR